jgi:isopentenyldiphosphate isomerase
MSSRIAVVDEANRFLRWDTRQVVHGQRLPHRSVHVLLFDTQGRQVLQRRHPDKLTYPDCWDIACAGHVDEEDYPAGPDERLDEVYAQVAARELAEELDVRVPLERLGAFAPEPGVHYEHLQLFRGTSDGPYRVQPEEVAEVRAVSPAELDLLLASDARLTHALRHWVAWLRVRHLW